MISVNLDSTHQRQFDELAAAVGEDSGSLARRIIMDYLDFQALPFDSEEEWSAASTALASEVMAEENWDDDANYQG
jgi:predicted transcriptional regulator